MAARVALDAAGSPTVLGGTLSLDLPVTPGAYQPRFGGGGNRNVASMQLGDLFLCRFTPDLGRTDYATYLGGPLTEDAMHGSDLVAMPDGRTMVLTQLPATGPPQTPGQGVRTLTAAVDRDGRTDGVMLYPMLLGVRLVADPFAPSGNVALLQPAGATGRAYPLRRLPARAASRARIQIRSLADPSLRFDEPMQSVITPVTRQLALLATSAPPPGTALPNTRLRLRVALCRVSGP
jgi:hypothetical protein